VGVPIPEKEIAAIRAVLREETAVPHPFVQLGQRVRICGGSLDGIEGILTSMAGNKSLVVSVQVIQKSVAVRISGYTVVPV
jgi:transcription antitermination factor NusG